MHCQMIQSEFIERHLLQLGTGIRSYGAICLKFQSIEENENSTRKYVTDNDGCKVARAMCVISNENFNDYLDVLN